MRPSYFLPYTAKWIGLFLILLHVPVRAVWEYYNPGGEHEYPGPDASQLFDKPHLFFIASTLLVLSGLFLIAFSKEKIEDEQISQLRLVSLRWSIYLNYALLILSLIFTNGINFVDILRLNLWLPLVFFILRFRWVIFRQSKMSNTSSI